MSMEGYRRAQKLAAAKKFGADAVATEQMVQAREWLAPSDFDEEPDFARSAHLSYRYMNPYQRTQSFYEAYRKHYLVRFRRRKGRDPQAFPNGIHGLEAGDFTSIWRARQRADAMGVPYERYVIELMLDADASGTRQLPRPNQLCADSKLPMLVERLEEKRAEGLFDPFAEDFDPRFYAANFVGDQQQLDALTWMEEQIANAGIARRPVLLNRFMCVEQLISDEDATRRFGQELVDEAKAHRGGYTSRAPVVLDAPVPSDPACFGMRTEGHAVCSQCPVAQRCAEFCAGVEAGVQARFGVLDVPKERKRIAANERKRRQRERERNGAAMTDQELRRVLKEAGDPWVIQRREKDKQRRDGKKRKSQA
ncbi:hypothetical protein [Stenotrophomonas maltophilia]|uniref:hypothetical protein n=1 Tax=Stenotrophomonas maltophilia TaxID=40324 RepID=UPI0013DB3ABC|nr:hypothetical protein [Stenotrophomonas maltophilia]